LAAGLAAVAVTGSLLARSGHDRTAAAAATAMAGSPPHASSRLIPLPHDGARADGAMIYVDPELAPDVQAPPGGQTRPLMNLFYERLEADFVRHRQRWSGLPQLALPPGPDLRLGSRDPRVRLLRQRLGIAPGPDPARFDGPLADAVASFRDAHGLLAEPVLDRPTLAAMNRGERAYEAIVRRNLDRLRAIPANPGQRYIVVDVAGARLWLVEDGRVRNTMQVVVGKPSMPTPQLAAYIRFVVFNPYWNIPPDIIRDSIAPKVLAQGPGFLARERLELLSGWGDGARMLQPDKVDWRAVAAGKQRLHVRQQPGGDNFMGRVKFMLPNRMGIYLHDTPNRAAFAKSDRRLSSGCVRVEDAARLAAWLLPGQQLPWAHPSPERRVDLPEPVPVYITYLTAVSEAGGIRFQPDPYQLDQ
jgi:murein L,D-transpeptidase YcbB/YkuD